MTRRLLVADDEEKILLAIKTYMESKGYLVQTAADGNEAWACFERGGYDLLVLDLMMPGLSGEELCRRVRTKSRVPIILLTAKTEEDDILEGFRIGADDYVTKPFSLKQLEARIDAVSRRASGEVELLANELVFEEGELVIDHVRREVRKNGKAVSLTPNEYMLIHTLAKFPTKVFTRSELIEQVLGEDFDGFDRAIDSHIKNIRIKLEEDSKAPKYIITVHGVGYKFGR